MDSPGIHGREFSHWIRYGFSRERGAFRMIRTNYHSHTSYCDGRNTADEMAAAAYAAGLVAWGFSGHGYTAYNEEYCMSRENTQRYIEDVRRLKGEYAGRMEIYLGVEYDAHGQRPDFPRDYTIGSLHEILVNGVYVSVDHTAEILERGVREQFGGDWYIMARSYFQQLASVRDITDCDFIGHCDLLTKFNEGGRCFDESDRRYRDMALEVLEYLCKQGGVFEINTGAMSRGYRSAPYPSEPLLRAIRDFGGAIVFSSDSHSADTVASYFDRAEALARRCGFRTHRVLLGGRWQEVPI